MTTETVIAPSLNDVVRVAVRALIRRYHLNRDWIIGLVGLRGSGKSLGGGNIAVRDFAMNGEPLFSNMNIKLGVDIPEDVSRQFGMDAGRVVYESQRIEREDFLALDGRFGGGCIFLDEINIEYGEARRSSSNVNLGTDTVIQQLRKEQSGLVYTVINEMYVDPRIRENTDVFIRCNDVAFYPQNLANKMKQGVCFEWNIYPMTEKLAGIGRNKEGVVIGPIQVTLGANWGMIDTWERQSRNGRKYSDVKPMMPVELKEAEAVSRTRSDPVYTQLESRLEAFWNKHAKDGKWIELSSTDFRRELNIEKDVWPHIVKNYLRRYFFTEDDDEPTLVTQTSGGRTKYLIQNRVLVE